MEGVAFRVGVTEFRCGVVRICSEQGTYKYRRLQDYGNGLGREEHGMGRSKISATHLTL